MSVKVERIAGLAIALSAIALCMTGPVAVGADGKDQAASIPGVYRSPLSLAVSPEGKTLYASDITAANVAILDLASSAKRGEVALQGQPRGMALSKDGKTLYVAEQRAGTVAVVDTAKAAVTGRIPVGRWPVALALAEQAKRLYVCNQDTHTVSVIDLSQTPPKSIKQIAAIREPSSAALTSDEGHLVVTNLLPQGAGTDPKLGAKLTILDSSRLVVSATVELPPGSTVVRHVCISPDGKWAYVVHSLGRFNLPITQLERGWVNTYAFSIVDIANGTRLATLLLDDLTQGAANPFEIVCSKDGKRLWISHAGVHKVSMIDIGLVHELLDGKVPEELASLQDGARPNVWVRIQKDRAVIDELENDLTALYIAGAIRKVAAGGNGPRGLALSPDEKQLFVANYYAGSVAVLDAMTGALLKTISLGPQRPADTARRGEIIFHDATYSFQYWNSCASCHPNQGRVDGLRWDFLRDGIGNPKDTPSLVFVDKTEPLNRRIISGAMRHNAREGARSGLSGGSHMLVPDEKDVDTVLAYMVSLRPEPNPHLTAEGKLTEAAQRGKKLFEGKADCASCHPAPYYTDKQTHNIGVLTPNEPDGEYDTPSLIECYRSAPYLHDGRAATLKDVMVTHDPEGSHGELEGLSEQEIDDLTAFLMSL